MNDGGGEMVGVGVLVIVGVGLAGAGVAVGVEVGVGVLVGFVVQVIAIGGENWEKKLRSLQSLHGAHAYWA